MKRIRRFAVVLGIIVLIAGVAWVVYALAKDWPPIAQLTEKLSLPTAGATESIAGDTLRTVPWAQIVAGIVILLFGFLIVDRWRQIENNVREIRQNGDKAASETKTQLKERVDKYLDDRTQKLVAMDNKVSKLLEDHPWIIGLTENDFVPNIPSCRIVLTTSRELHARGKNSLVYEYLFYWLRADKAIPKLGGTLDDFYDLIRFCESKLCDDYLCIMILEHVIKYLECGDRLLPDYCRRLIRAGDYSTASDAAVELRRIVKQPWWKKLLHRPIHPLMQRTNFAFHAHVALALFAVSNGTTEEEDHAAQALILAKKLDRTVEMDWANLERKVHAGEYDAAKQQFAVLAKSSIPSDYAYLGRTLTGEAVTNSGLDDPLASVPSLNERVFNRSDFERHAPDPARVPLVDGPMNDVPATSQVGGPENNGKPPSPGLG